MMVCGSPRLREVDFRLYGGADFQISWRFFSTVKPQLIINLWFPNLSRSPTSCMQTTYPHKTSVVDYSSSDFFLLQRGAKWGRLIA
jgi:hypothetical protein